MPFTCAKFTDVRELSEQFVDTSEADFKYGDIKNIVWTCEANCSEYLAKSVHKRDKNVIKRLFLNYTH